MIIENGLDSVGIVGYEIRQLDDRNFVVTSDLLDDAAKEGIEEAITFSRIEFKFDPELELPDDSGVNDVVEEQGLENYQVEATGKDNFFRITTYLYPGRRTAGATWRRRWRSKWARLLSLRWKRKAPCPSPSARYSRLPQTRWKVCWTG